MKQIIIAIVLIGFMGCSKAPVLKVYTLNAPSVDTRYSAQYKNKSIKISYPQSIKEPLSENMQFSYGLNDRGAYQNSQWSNNISKLIQGALIDVLDSSRLFRVVLSDTSTLQENYRLETNIFEFEHKIRGTASYADVSIQFTLINADSGSLAKSKRFSYRENTLTKDAKGYANATNKIMQRLSADLLNWLKGTSK